MYQEIAYAVVTKRKTQGKSVEQKNTSVSTVNVTHKRNKKIRFASLLASSHFWLLDSSTYIVQTSQFLVVLDINVTFPHKTNINTELMTKHAIQPLEKNSLNVSTSVVHHCKSLSSRSTLKFTRFRSVST